MPDRRAIELSIVIPANNEAENLSPLIEEIKSVLQDRDFEIIVVDDGSTDSTPQVLERLSTQDPRVRTVRHGFSCGKSGAVVSGARVAKSDFIAILDGDGQNDPAYLPESLEIMQDNDVGIVAGQRTRRGDSRFKLIQSRIANTVRAAVLKDGTRDTGCGFKVVRRAAFVELPYFEGLHRFLPALIAGDGWKVVHIDVIDRPRRHGVSHYGALDRLRVGIFDMFGVLWLIRRRARHPLKSSKDGSI